MQATFEPKNAHELREEQIMKAGGKVNMWIPIANKPTTNTTGNMFSLFMLSVLFSQLSSGDQHCEEIP